MNFLKSIFISIFPVVALAIAVFAGMELSEHGFSWQYATSLSKVKK